MATSLYEEIREAILTGRFAPGQVLSENALATEFGKSRTPVREALHRLEIEALVERVPRGVRVRTSSPEEILDIYDVRITLEGAAAKAAAERATELDRTRLRSAQQAMVDAETSAAAQGGRQPALPRGGVERESQPDARGPVAPAERAPRPLPVDDAHLWRSLGGGAARTRGTARRDRGPRRRVRAAHCRAPHVRRSRGAAADVRRERAHLTRS